MPAVKTKRSGTNGAVCHNRVSKYINRDDYDAIREELIDASSFTCESRSVKDIILRGSAEKKIDRDSSLNEKYILRFPKNDNESAILIKECTNGSKIKQVTEPVSHETVLRIIERSTKWLCSSLSPLIRELGVKMTTERLRPDTVMSFERETFAIDNRVSITADSGISLCDYNAENDGIITAALFSAEPVDSNVCLLQVNYERIIPDNISSLIGLKAT